MLDEEFNKVKSSLCEHYSNAEIDKDCFVITKEDLSEGNLEEKEIL